MGSLLFMSMPSHDILSDACKNNSDEYNLRQIYIQFRDEDKDISPHKYMPESINTTPWGEQTDKFLPSCNLENACISLVFFSPVGCQGTLHLWMKMRRDSWSAPRFISSRLAFWEVLLLRCWIFTCAFYGFHLRCLFGYYLFRMVQTRFWLFGRLVLCEIEYLFVCFLQLYYFNLLFFHSFFALFCFVCFNC
jgi:hypothetical protein